MLNKANKLMEQRKAMIDEARQVLVVLGAEDVPVTPVVESTIVINKGKVVKVTNNEEVDRLFKENARHIRRINELAAENESLLEQLNLLDNNYTVKADRYDELEEEIMKAESEIAFKDGQIIGYKRQVKELEDKIAELQAALGAKKLTKKIKPLQDELKDYKEELEKEEPKKVVNNVIPKKEAVEVIKYENGYMHGIVRFKYRDKKQEYKFTASNRFDKVILYGETDEKAREIAKETIIKHKGNIFVGYKPADESEILYAEDKNYNIVAYCEQGVFYGFYGVYYFVWNPGHDVPAGCLIKHMHDDNRTLRKMNASWGNGFVKRAEDIMALCKEMNYIDYKREQVEAERGCASSVSSSNEVVVNVEDMSDDDILDIL